MNYGKAYAYADKGGTPHVVEQEKTARESSKDGKVYEYHGFYSGGYACDCWGRPIFLVIPGVDMKDRDNKVFQGRACDIPEIVVPVAKK
jgi:hypothetical protein